MKTYSCPVVVLKVVRKFRTDFCCESCGKKVEAKQDRKYVKENQNYIVFNLYNCTNCGYHFETKPEVVPEYQAYPRLDDNCFEMRETDVELPINMGDNIVNVQVIGVKDNG